MEMNVSSVVYIGIATALKSWHLGSQRRESLMKRDERPLQSGLHIYPSLYMAVMFASYVIYLRYF